jgi:hypothetical protein
MSIGSLPFVVAGTLGITGYTVGNGVANKLNGQDFFSNWDVRDAALSYGFSGVTGGIIKPSLASLGFQGPVVTGVTAGVMSGAQYIVRQNLYNNGKIDSSALFVQSTFSMFASSGSASLVGSSSSLGAQLGRTLVSSVSKGAVLGELKAISGWIANTIDISLRIAARQAYSKYNYGTNDIFAYPAY